jgi:single-strand DNA-binding protein
LALVLAVFRRPVAWASAVLLALFAGAMTLSFGIKAPDAELRSRFIEFFSICSNFITKRPGHDDSGNLVANPTLRETNSGTPVASVTIANNEFFNDGEGERQQVTTFVDMTVWGKSGEGFASLAKKGQEVIIEGQLRRNNWESEDGQKHSKHFLKAESWQFTQYRRQEESTEAAPEKGAEETKKAASKDTG